MFKFNELDLFKGEGYTITKNLHIKHPKVDDVRIFGEERYYQTVQTLCATPADFKVQLDDAGVDFQKITDLELFVMLGRNIPKKDLSVFFDGVDFQAMKIMNSAIPGEVMLYDPEQNVSIDKIAYTIMTDFLRKIHGLKKNEEYAGNEITKRIMIDIERKQQELRKQKGEGFKSVIAPYLSALTNCAESNYDIYNVWDLPIYVFFDAVKRINKIKQSGYMLTGAYGGWVDAKQFNKDDLDWLGELK